MTSSPLGWKPGPKFKTVLDAVQVRQLEGILRTREEAISWVEKEFAANTPGVERHSGSRRDVNLALPRFPLSTLKRS